MPVDRPLIQDVHHIMSSIFIWIDKRFIVDSGCGTIDRAAKRSRFESRCWQFVLTYGKHENQKEMPGTYVFVVQREVFIEVPTYNCLVILGQWLWLVGRVVASDTRAPG